MNTRLDVSVFMRAGGQNVHTKNAGFYPGRLEQAMQAKRDKLKIYSGLYHES